MQMQKYTLVMFDIQKQPPAVVCEKETPTQVFFWEIKEIYKNAYFQTANACFSM